MSANEKMAAFRAEAERRNQEYARESLAIGAAILGPIFWLLLRTIYVVNQTPGHDVNYDGAFSISDLWRAIELTFTEPAYIIISSMPAAFFNFFETTIYSFPGWAMFLASLVCWYFIAQAIFLGAGVILSAWAQVKRGFVKVDGEVQGRFKGLMAGDLIAAAVIITVIGGVVIGLTFGW